MKINDKDLEDFMALYRAEFGKYISQKDALEMTTRLINLYLMIYRPLPSKHGDRTTPPLGDHHDPGAAVLKAE